jgi:hypothetical protein
MDFDTSIVLGMSRSMHHGHRFHATTCVWEKQK